MENDSTNLTTKCKKKYLLYYFGQVIHFIHLQCCIARIGIAITVHRVAVCNNNIMNK